MARPLQAPVLLGAACALLAVSLRLAAAALVPAYVGALPAGLLVVAAASLAVVTGWYATTTGPPRSHLVAGLLTVGAAVYELALVPVLVALALAAVAARTGR